MNDRKPVYYTFGNHMHWVDMEWLWGYHVLPGSIRDMLAFCKHSGAKGNVNFDGIGYEKLAAEDPEALGELRQAVAKGDIEPVGCSYGQPYGLFHGGESNVRQLIYGARVVRRLLGRWPKSFWEEEFDFFPQLPQMLASAGFTGASLYFQWTWHTPEIPKESEPVVWWVGHDGTQMPCATRNELNLHQWPEDVDALLSDLTNQVADRSTTPMIQQWLELMPSPDWMCRSEVLLPKTRELLADSRFEIKTCTLGEYLRAVTRPDLPRRHYAMDDVWHGLTLGKNGDDMRRRSREAESRLLLAETLAVLASAMGRPYAQWDVYPAWELEEAWRELLAAQHHDNDECEGLCGRFGKRQYERALGMAEDVLGLQLSRLFPQGSFWRPENTFVVNPFGWKSLDGDGCRTIPAFSITPRRWNTNWVPRSLDREGAFLTQGARDDRLEARFDLASCSISRLQRPGGPNIVPNGIAFGRLLVGDEPVKMEFLEANDIDRQFFMLAYSLGGEETFNLEISRSNLHDGLDICFDSWNDALVKLVSPGYKGALSMEFPLPWANAEVIVDTPYAVHRVGSGSKGVRKYPEGDWMTSPQWFEDVSGAFTAQNFVDIVNPDTGEGVLIAHNGNQQWFKREGTVRCILSAEDPWDENFYRERMSALFGDGNAWKFAGNFRIIPHGPIDDAERWKIGQEFRRQHLVVPTSVCREGESSWGESFTFADIEPHNVVMTALYRETEDRGANVENYAGIGMGYPTVIRLLELNGSDTNAVLSFGGTVAKAFKTNLLGTIEQELEPVGHQLVLPMRPFEIATLYLDIVECRKQARNLDAKREVWATVHRR